MTDIVDLSSLVVADNNGRGLFEDSLDQVFRKTLTCDVDGDGDEDVISQATGGLRSAVQPMVMENLDGLGNFGPMRALNVDSGGALLVACLDMQGDGLPDLVFRSVSDEPFNVTWHLNMNSSILERFSQEATVTLHFEVSGRRVTQLEVSDINADGLVDVVVAGRQKNVTNPITMLHQAFGGLAVGPGNTTMYFFTPWTNVSGTFGSLQDISDFALGDIDANGYTDLIMSRKDSFGCNGSTPHSVWFPGRPEGLQLTEFHCIQPSLEGSIFSIVDLDLDGDSDILKREGGRLMQYVNRPTGVLIFQEVVPAGLRGDYRLGSFSVTDCDNDGRKTDLVYMVQLSNGSTPVIACLTQTTSGTWNFSKTVEIEGNSLVSPELAQLPEDALNSLPVYQIPVIQFGSKATEPLSTPRSIVLLQNSKYLSIARRMYDGDADSLEVAGACAHTSVCMHATCIAVPFESADPLSCYVDPY